jgi:hypothetical protein
MRFLVLILLALVFTNHLFAHTCTTYKKLDKEHRRELQKIAAIFYGEVISIDEIRSVESEPNYGTQDLRVKVLRSWKGVEVRELSVVYRPAYFSFQKEYGGVGTRKVFYALKSKDSSQLSVEYCSFGLFDDDKMKLEYGDGKGYEELLPVPPLENEELLPVPPLEKTESFLSYLWNKIISFFS